MGFSDAITYGSITLALGDMMTAAAPGSGGADALTPPDILKFLAGLRMLQGVPFNNLVPDTELLPNESIRFFFLDRAWTDALVQGALSVATANTVERAQLEQLYPTIEAEIDDAERRFRAPGGEPVMGGSAGQVSGFLMRSAAVAGWPGMHVRAYRTEPAANDEQVLPETHASRIKLLRLERLAPAVLLALFDGIPSVVHIEEPRQGLQFGTRLSQSGNGQFSATVPARNVRSGKYVNAAGVELQGNQNVSQNAAPIPVRFRAGAAGVIDMTNTARAFRAAAGTGMTGTGDSIIDGAEFAMQMMRFPYRQVFAQSGVTAAIQEAAFRPSVAKIASRNTALLRAKIKED